MPYRLSGFPLSHEGKATVEKLADTFSGKHIAAIYSSPLERTRETAEILAKKLNMHVLFDDRLLEVRSPAQGKPVGFTESMGGWKIYDSEWYKKNNGESVQEIFERMQSFMKEKIAEYKGKEIIVVSHGDPIMIYRANDHVSAEKYIQTGECIALTFPA